MVNHLIDFGVLLDCQLHVSSQSVHTREKITNMACFSNVTLNGPGYHLAECWCVQLAQVPFRKILLTIGNIQSGLSFGLMFMCAYTCISTKMVTLDQIVALTDIYYN